MNANVNADAVPLVLGLACRNSHLGSDLQAVCSLLRVSKAVQQAVLDACSGPGSSQLQVTIDGDANTAVAHGVGSPLQYLRRLSHQAQWLARHGGLVKQLSINKCTTIPNRDLSRDLDGADEAVVCLAVRPPVQLQELQLGQTYGSLLNPAAVLQQLDASHLTQLSVGIPVGNYGAALMPAALQQLTALRCLRVFAGHHALCPLQQPQILQAYLEALPRLTRLTELSWRGSISADLLKQLPARVLKVRLAMPTGKLEVQHLADKQQLQQLHLGFTGCDTTALASLSALTRLQHLSLHMPACKADSLTQHGSSLAALSTLKQLHIGIHYADALSPAAASAIAAATSVTNLQLRCFRRFHGDLTAAFEPLVGLQRLCVMDVTFGAGGSLVSFGTALTRGITHLVWCGRQLAPLARTQLITCTQLQLLIIDSDSVGNEDLEVMGHYMKDLQVLGIVVCGVISVAGLRSALSDGRFPALRKLLAAGCPSSRAEVAECVASAKPFVDVEHLESFAYNFLRDRFYVM